MKIQPEFNIAAIIGKLAVAQGNEAGAHAGSRERAPFTVLFEAALQDIDDPELAATIATLNESGMITPQYPVVDIRREFSNASRQQPDGSDPAPTIRTVKLMNGRSVLISPLAEPDIPESSVAGMTAGITASIMPRMFSGSEPSSRIVVEVPTADRLTTVPAATPQASTPLAVAQQAAPQQAAAPLAVAPQPVPQQAAAPLAVAPQTLPQQTAAPQIMAVPAVAPQSSDAEQPVMQVAGPTAMPREFNSSDATRRTVIQLPAADRLMTAPAATPQAAAPQALTTPAAAPQAAAAIAAAEQSVPQQTAAPQIMAVPAVAPQSSDAEQPVMQVAGPTAMPREFNSSDATRRTVIQLPAADRLTTAPTATAPIATAPIAAPQGLTTPAADPQNSAKLASAPQTAAPAITMAASANPATITRLPLTDAAEPIRRTTTGIKTGSMQRAYSAAPQAEAVPVSRELPNSTTRPVALEPGTVPAPTPAPAQSPSAATLAAQLSGTPIDSNLTGMTLTASPVTPTVTAATASTTEPPAPASPNQRWMHIDNLGKQFGEFIQSAVLNRNVPGQTSLRIMLNPEHLGAIEAEIIEKNQTVTVNLTAQSEEVVRLLRDYSANLREALGTNSTLELNITRDKGGSEAGAGRNQSGAAEQSAHSDSNDSTRSEQSARAPTPSNPNSLDTYV
jgi:hypothetical protein